METTTVICCSSANFYVINQIMKFRCIITIIIVTVNIPIGIFNWIHVQCVLSENTPPKHTYQEDNGD